MSRLNPSPDTSRHYFRMMLESQKDQLPSHAIIGLLYAELIRSLDRLIAALDAAPDAIGDDEGAALNAAPDAELAQSILTALADSVDFEHAGSLAPLLSSLYERAGQQLASGLTRSDIGKLRDMRAAVSDIAYSWQVLAD